LHALVAVAVELTQQAATAQPITAVLVVMDLHHRSQDHQSHTLEVVAVHLLQAVEVQVAQAAVVLLTDS
jgi:hypothetical protein